MEKMGTNHKSSIVNRKSRIVILGGGESGVGTAILGKKKGFEAVSYTHLTLPTSDLV